MILLTVVILAILAVLAGIAGIVILIVVSSRRNRLKSGDNGKTDYYQQSKKSIESLGAKLRRMLSGKTINSHLLDQIEESLISADIGPRISYDLIEGLKKRGSAGADTAVQYIKDELSTMVGDTSFSIKRGELNVILVLGVNGVGKTTTIAKLAHRLLGEGNTVLLAAADTFRAAATEQLTKWATRLSIPVIKQQHGADPASIVFDAIDSARAKGVDVLIVDTAGRLHNKKDLMGELQKIEQIINRKGDMVRKNLLIIDATTGQNGLQQAKSFNEFVGVDGIILTKYDSRSKGGIVITIQKELNIPFYFIGHGEQLEDMTQFRSKDFIEKIFE